MEKSILVIGGYGEVGKYTARYLSRFYPGKVIVAGRRLAKAQAFAESTGGAVRAMQLDINDLPIPEEYLDGVGTVISSIERTDDRVVRDCLKRDIHYTEIAASFATLTSVLQLRTTYTESRSAIIAGVGLIPGLSAVLAAHAAEKLERIEEVESHILLGAGDVHGVDAIRLMQESMNSSFTIRTKDGVKTVHGLTEPHRVRFPNERYTRTTYRFDLADQHIIPDSVGAKGASTYVCFDSRFLTLGLRYLKKVGLSGHIRRIPPAKLTKMMKAFPMGSDRYALQVIATEEGTGRVLEAGATGRIEAHATGIVAGVAVRRLHEQEIPKGIHHLENVIRLSDMQDELTREGISLHLPQPVYQVDTSPSSW